VTFVDAVYDDIGDDLTHHGIEVETALGRA